MLDNSTQSVIQTAIAAGLPTLSVLVGILINNSRLNDLNRRVDDVRHDMRDMRQDLIHHFDTSLQRVEEVMDARLKHLEERQ